MEPAQKESASQAEQQFEQCSFFVARKQRRCRLRSMPGQTLCVEHCPSGLAAPDDNRGDRIRCPLDPKHTVYAKQLEKHLTRCNSRPRLTGQTFYQPGVNSCDSPEDKSHDKRWSLLDPPEHMRSRISEIIALVESLVPDSELADCSDSALSNTDWPTMAAELEAVAKRAATSLEKKTSVKRVRTDSAASYCSTSSSSDEDADGDPRAVTNLRQQANLLALAERSNLLRSPCAYVEFGAGKGHLCHWVARYWLEKTSAVPGDQDASERADPNAYLLIDRGSVRNKFDCAHKYSGQRFARIRIDIADLVLRRLLLQASPLTNLPLKKTKPKPALLANMTAKSKPGSVAMETVSKAADDSSIATETNSTSMATEASATNSTFMAIETLASKSTVTKANPGDSTKASLNVQAASRSGVTALGKHLCGAATDLALRCLAGLDNSAEDANSSSEQKEEEGSHIECREATYDSDGRSDNKRPRVSLVTDSVHKRRSSSVGPVGGVIALCCHHRCLWSAYVGKRHLARLGIGPDEFHAICRMAGWATCAGKAERKRRQLNDDRRELIGLKCKRLIDTGRVAYLTEQLGYSAKLVRYARQADTLENAALVFSRDI